MRSIIALLLIGQCPGGQCPSLYYPYVQEPRYYYTTPYYPQLVRYSQPPVQQYIPQYQPRQQVVRQQVFIFKVR
jgi:hypothetical protein